MNYFGITDRGVVRKNNQDVFLCEDIRLINAALLVVCDGMGGAKSGNIASAMAAQVFRDSIFENLDVFGDNDALALQMKIAAAHANSAVHEKSLNDPDCSGMGTTIVAAIVKADSAIVLNVGDSRAYKISRTDGIEQITKDHSFVGEMVYKGEITKEEARRHPNKNLITRAIGTSETVIADTFIVSIKESDRLLLCSDGLSNMVDDDHLCQEVLKTDEMALCCEELIKAAVVAGAPDNVTAALIRI